MKPLIPYERHLERRPPAEVYWRSRREQALPPPLADVRHGRTCELPLQVFRSGSRRFRGKADDTEQ